MTNIFEIANKRQPVKFTVEIIAHWDGSFDATVHDVSESERSQNAVCEILVRLAEKYLARRVGHAADAMLAIMLANIDSAMSATDEAPAIFRVTPAELSTWADAVQEYEAARFPSPDNEG